MRAGFCRDVGKEPTELVNGQVEKEAERWEEAEPWGLICLSGVPFLGEEWAGWELTLPFQAGWTRCVLWKSARHVKAEARGQANDRNVSSPNLSPASVKLS